MSSRVDAVVKKYKLIPEVKKDEIGWTAKVTVLQKTLPRVAARSTTKHQSLVFIDPEGNTVRASIFNAAITAFQNKFQMHKTYLISNAAVKEAKPEYRKHNDELHWTITARTIVQEVNENHDKLLERAYSFTSFSELQLYMDKPTDINSLAIIIDICPKRRVQSKFGGDSTIQELILINKELQTSILTMWDAFAENECNTISSIIHRKPIIVGLRLSVVSHDGKVNVQTTQSTCFVIDSQFEAAKLLRNWITENTTQLNNIINNKNYHASAIFLHPPPREHIIPIKNINDMILMRKTFWVEGMVSIKDFGQPFWYTACDRCHRVTGSQIDTIFECLFCNTSQAKAIPWPRIDVNIHDSTGFVSATVFGEIAEKLFSCVATDFISIRSQNPDQISSHSFLKLSNEAKRVIYLKSPKNNAAEVTKFTIVFACEQTDSNKQQWEPKASSSQITLQERLECKDDDDATQSKEKQVSVKSVAQAVSEDEDTTHAKKQKLEQGSAMKN